MRLRFSLRTLLTFTGLTAMVFTWMVLPSLRARRFLGELVAEDYRSADAHFHNSTDQFLVRWANNRWAFRATGDLAPLTASQLVTGRRGVIVRLDFFDLDQNASCTGQVSANAFGLGPVKMSPASYSGRYIDSRPTNGTETRPEQ